MKVFDLGGCDSFVVELTGGMFALKARYVEGWCDVHSTCCSLELDPVRTHRPPVIQSVNYGGPRPCVLRSIVKNRARGAVKRDQYMEGKTEERGEGVKV